MKKLLLIFFCIALLAFTTGDSKSDYIIPSWAKSIFTEDIDLDNDQDLIIGHLTGVGYTNPSITLLKNDGQGYFDVFDTSITYLGSQTDIFANDFYGNIYPEIITNYSETDKSKTSSYIRILNLDSSGVIGHNDLFLSNEFGFSNKTYGDSNGDGLTDIIISSYGCQCWGILYNEGQGNFAEPVYYYDVPHNDMAAGFINEDSLTDVVLCGSATEIFYSTGTGFTNQTIDNGSLRVIVEDVNGDQKNDIIGFDNLYAITWITFYENTGNTSFIQHEVIELSSGCYNFATSQLNNDNLPDILCLLNSQAGIYILYNTGDFTLADPVFVPIDYYGESTRRIHSDDLDGNGYNDIIVIRGYGAPLPANLTILFNDGNGNFVENPITGIEIPKTKNQIQNLLCYPNPVHSNATIEFFLEKPSEVTMVLLNNSGRIVKNLIDHTSFPKGTHTFPLKINGLTRGIYYIKLFMNKTNSQSIKIIIN